MRMLWDYLCPCGNRFEVTAAEDERVDCPSCGGKEASQIPGGQPFGTIVPMHRTSLKSKAGYVHTHGDRPAEKGSVAIPANKGDF